MSSNSFKNSNMNGVVLHSSSRRKRVLTAQQRRKYLQKFKNKLKSPKVKFLAMMKLGLKCLQENERVFFFKMPIAFYTRVIVNLSDLVQKHHLAITKKSGNVINVKTVNALRNKIAVKNAFMKYVVKDSLPWARKQIQSEMGQFGKCKYVVREYYEEIEQINNEEGQPKEGEIQEVKEEANAEEEEEIQVKRVYLNPEKEVFVNDPIHKQHLSSKFRAMC